MSLSRTYTTLLLCTLAGFFLAPVCVAAPVFRYSVFSGTDLRPVIPDSSSAGNGATASVGLAFSGETPTSGVPADSGDRSLDIGSNLAGLVTDQTLLLENSVVAAHGGFTMECWFRWNGGGTVNAIIDYAGTEKIVLDTRRDAPGLVEFEINNASRHRVGVATPGEWHYVAVVFDSEGNLVEENGALSGTLRVYFDGIHSGEEFEVQKNSFGDSLVRRIGIGQHPEGFAPDVFDGLIFEPRVSLGVVRAEDLLLFGDLPGRVLEVSTPIEFDVTAKEPTALFRLRSEPWRSLEVTITDEDGTDHNNLYLRWGTVATRARFDVAADGPGVAANRRLVEPLTRADTAWLLVDGAEVGADFGNCITILAEYRDLILEDLSVARSGVAGALVPARVLGGGFRDGVTFALELVNAGDSVLATDVVVINHDRAEMVFDVSGLSPGEYDLVASDAVSGQTGTLPAAFEKTSGTREGRLEATLSGPRFVRSGRRGLLEIRYRNSGDVGMLAPLFRLQAPLGTVLRLERDLVVVEGETYALGIHPNGVPGFLPAGAEGRLGVEFENDCTDCALDFVLSSFSPGTTDIAGRIPPPDGFDPSVWEERWIGLIKENLLRTWADFHVLVAGFSTRFSRRGVNASSLDALLRRTIVGQPSGAVVGRLLSRATATPIVGQSVFTQIADQEYVCTLTDSRGSFVLEGLAPGTEYSLEVPFHFAVDGTQVRVPEQGGDGAALQLLTDDELGVGGTDCPFITAIAAQVLPRLPPDLFTPVASLRVQTLSALDPNEKEGPTGPDPLASLESREGGPVRPGTRMVYTIHFENIGGAGAHRVEIVDDLDVARLDPATVELVAVELGPANLFHSFGVGRSPTCTGVATGDLFSGLTRPRSLSPSGFSVSDLEVTGGGEDFQAPLCMNFTQTALSFGRVIWTLEGSVDPDDVGGILPPNDDSGRGEGRIVFSVRLRDDAPLGELENEASIIFDAQPAIDTQPWRNRVAVEPEFRRCDANDDGESTIADASFGLNFLFLGGPSPACMKAADCDDSGELELTDAVFHLNFLFLGGRRPLAPLDDCGVDPTEDRLSCGPSSGCP